MEIFAKRLKSLREEKDISMREMARILKITPAGYQNYEYNGGQPRFEILIKIAQHFGVTTDYLLGLTDV